MFSGKSRILAEEMNSWWTFVSVLVEDDDILLTKQVHSGIDFIVRFACLLLLLLCFFFFLIFIQNLTSHLHNHSCLLQAGKKKHLTLFEFDSFLIYHLCQLLYIGKVELLLFSFMSRQIQASVLIILCYGNLERVMWTEIGGSWMWCTTQSL